VREPCFCQYLFQAKPLPDLMAHMHGAGLTGLLDFEGLGVKLHSPSCRFGTMRGRCELGSYGLLACAFSQQAPLSAQRVLEIMSQSKPMLSWRRSQRSE
jgi:hypothetical protein